jgi:hypothetical protein
MGFGILRGVAAVLLLLVVGGIGYAIGMHQGGPMVGPDGAAQMHYYGHWGGGGGFHIFGFIIFFFLIMLLLRFVFSPWRHRGGWGGGWGGPGYWGGGYSGGPWMRGGYWGGPMGPGGPGGAGNGPGADGPAGEEWQAHLDEMHRRSHERMDATSQSSTGNDEPPASAQ